MHKVSVVVPNWNGEKLIGHCLDSLQNQSMACQIIVVENGSTDGSVEFIAENYTGVDLITHKDNLGFAGGVNSGIKKAMADQCDFVALFNNDAVADKCWLENLVKSIEEDDKIGIATSKLLDIKKEHLDSTGDLYTIWGLPFPRGRGEAVSDKYDKDTLVFAASGGASLYRIKMLEEIGLFDKDFFAYYEDVDLSFRAQLAGWQVKYSPLALAYHKIGGTSNKIRGFTTYQATKNLPWLLWKNVPTRYLWRIIPRFSLAYAGFLMSAMRRHQTWAALRGAVVSFIYAPKKLGQRIKIQGNKTVSDEYIWGIIAHDLPPNALKIRRLRDKWWKVARKTK